MVERSLSNIRKKQGIVNIERLSTILLLEASLKAVCKIIFNSRVIQDKFIIGRRT